MNFPRTRLEVLDPKVRDDIQILSSLGEWGCPLITSSPLDNDRWVVAYRSGYAPTIWYLYERKTRKPTMLLDVRRRRQSTSTKKHEIVVHNRLGFPLVSYLTLPTFQQAHGERRKPLPTVLIVHSGPWSRDYWRYDPEDEWLANRGYAVMRVNFRGSTGFGRSFVEASDFAWGGQMHEDLLDAIGWAVEKEVADRRRIAIMGTSYGGYAALYGLAFSPEVFACGVALCGPADLVSFQGMHHYASQGSRMVNLLEDVTSVKYFFP